MFDMEVLQSADAILLNDIDIVQHGGGVANKALTREAPATPKNGFITINFLENIPRIGNPKVTFLRNHAACPFYQLTHAPLHSLSPTI
jgi:hypothetical protein